MSRIITRPLLPPELLILSLTQSCNLKCITCSIKREITQESLYIDIDKIFDIVNQAKKVRIDTIVLSGGEPFLLKEAFEIVKYVKKVGMKISATTNGFYNDQIVEKIADSNIDHLHFSLDGLPEHHDEIRGKGTYDRLIRTIGLIRQLNPNQSIVIGIVICGKNCNDLFEMIKIADSL